MAKTIRMTVAQAIVKFLDNQYVSMDGEETKFVEGFFTIFGHGIAVGLGEALDTNPGNLRVLQGRNEQGMCHVATAYAKQNGRKKIIPCASSVGPGAANMVTACATATVNNIPLLVFPADTFASRQPDPVRCPGRHAGNSVEAGGDERGNNRRSFSCIAGFLSAARILLLRRFRPDPGNR